MLVRRSAFARVGPYDSRWRVGESIEWQSRAEEMGLKEQVLPQVLLLRRIHGGNMSLRRREDWLDYVRIARQALHRRCAGDSADTEGRDEGQVASKEVG